MGSGASFPLGEFDMEDAPVEAGGLELTAEEKARVFDAEKAASRQVMAAIKNERKWKAAAEEVKNEQSGRKYDGEKILLWISDGILSWPLAASAVKEGVLAISYAAKEQHELWDDIEKAMTEAEVPKGSFTNVGWMFHGTEMTGEHKEANLKFLAALKPYLAEGARVDILACELVAGPMGMEVFKELEKESGINLAASSDLTGNTAVGGNWLMETDGVNVQDVYFTENISYFTETLLGSVFSLKQILMKARGKK